MSATDFHNCNTDLFYNWSSFEQEMLTVSEHPILSLLVSLELCPRQSLLQKVPDCVKLCLYCDKIGEEIVNKILLCHKSIHVVTKIRRFDRTDFVVVFFAVCSSIQHLLYFELTRGAAYKYLHCKYKQSYTITLSQTVPNTTLSSAT